MIIPTESVNIELAERSYEIVIGAGLLGRFDSYDRLGCDRSQAVVVTNSVVGPLYAGLLKEALKARFRTVRIVELADGEAHKNWPTLNSIFDALLTFGCDRKTTLFALGGGVIGDMTGFAAACYMRGVPFVQVPTTLLAQVDSSVGGKTGINHPLGKNMIGAFHQPVLVVADLDTLHTLPQRELVAGLAEVMKCALVSDAAFLDWIEANLDALLLREMNALTYAVKRCCQIKASIVGRDERESGVRALLNFGHTFGHAIEAGMGYGQWLHGEAVGCGMVMAADLSCRMGYIDQAAVDRVRKVVAAAGLPIRAPDLGVARWLELMEVDKKNEGGAIKFILLKPLGSPCITAAPHELLLATLAAGVA